MCPFPDRRRIFFLIAVKTIVDWFIKRLNNKDISLNIDRSSRGGKWLCQHRKSRAQTVWKITMVWFLCCLLCGFTTLKLTLKRTRKKHPTPRKSEKHINTKAERDTCWQDINKEISVAFGNVQSARENKKPEKIVCWRQRDSEIYVSNETETFLLSFSPVRCIRSFALKTASKNEHIHKSRARFERTYEQACTNMCFHLWTRWWIYSKE